MTQIEARDAVAHAAKNVSKAYWAADNLDTKTQLLDLTVNLNTLLTQLDKEDLESRDADFTAAVKQMESAVLPAVKRLKDGVDKLVAVEGVVKTALEDVVQLSSVCPFFKIPIPNL